MSPEEFDEVVANSLVVTPISSMLIKPATPTKAHYIPLTNLDLLVLPVYSTLILLYRASERHDDPKKLLASLRLSLARTVEEFYPMAGRLVRLDRNAKPVIHCNDEGVLWNEASTDAALATIEDYYPVDQLLGLPTQKGGASPFYPALNSIGVPILAVQATVFKCGGISLSVAWHHNVADGASGWSFLRSWAEVSRGESISVAPNYDRSLLQPSSPPAPSVALSGYAAVCQGPPGRPELPLGPVHGEDAKQSCLPGGVLNLSSTTGMVLQKIYFGKEKVDYLKKQASEGAEKPFSSAVSVSAHLWRGLTRARKLSEDRVTHFSVTMDGRSRIPLPAGYFGNALSWACTESTVKELLSRPLSHAARLIDKSIASRTCDFYRSLIDTIEIYGAQKVQFQYHSFLGHDVAATFWTQMHLYDLDFGWGKPVFGSRNVIPRRALNGFFAVQPCAPEKGQMVAFAYLDSKLVERLRQDPDFL